MLSGGFLGYPGDGLEPEELNGTCLAGWVDRPPAGSQLPSKPPSKPLSQAVCQPAKAEHVRNLTAWGRGGAAWTWCQNLHWPVPGLVPESALIGSGTVDGQCQNLDGQFQNLDGQFQNLPEGAVLETCPKLVPESQL